jgi:predicted Fe-Mo cluster-binding NifX family protein
MKIAIPTDENNVSTDVCLSFGRTPYFLVYDTETQRGDFLDNSAAASQGGAGIKAAQELVDCHVEVLLTPRCGENAAEVMSAAGIQIYKTVNGSAMDNITAFQDGKLAILRDIHAGFHHGGK